MILEKVSALRRVLNPMLMSDVPIGTLTSPLEAVVERRGRDLVETQFRRSEIYHIGELFGRYLEDPKRGVLALKKALHVALEARMRALAVIKDPPEGHGLGPSVALFVPHPLDGAASAAFCSRPISTVVSNWAILTSVGLQAAALIAKTLFVAIIAPSSRAKKFYHIGTPAFGDANYWSPVKRAILDHGVQIDGALAAVTEGGYDIDPGDGISRLDPRACAIDRPLWWRKSVVPAIKLSLAVLWSIVRHRNDPAHACVAWYAVHLARHALDFERILHHVKFGCYLDITEYTPDHIVKAALLDRTGSRLVRWPHCIMDNPGASLSYLGYHHFLGTGPYEAETYGVSWLPECARQSIGFFKNDRRWINGTASAEMVRALDMQKHAGRRVLAYFGPSGTSLLAPVVEETLAAVLRAVQFRQDWCVVIKAKGAGATRHLTEALDHCEEASTLRKDGRLIVVPYATGGAEPCPAGWLIGEMALGVGLGSVQLEGLTQGKPVFSYLPVVPDSPFQRKLAECDLGHSESNRFSSALERWLRNPEQFRIPFEWFSAHFDPFSDDHALDRIVACLWRDEPI